MAPFTDLQEHRATLGNITLSSPEKRDLASFILDRGNAKLGDALVNLIYSIAKSLVLKKTTGIKVSDSILSEAYRKSLWRETLGLHGRKDFLADRVEALILFFWIHGSVSWDEMVAPLVSQLKPELLHHPREEHLVAVNAFKNLLDVLFQTKYSTLLSD
ncbi:MAG: ribonuclease III family protein [Candidatus Heimdallarchaeota archaeon]